MAFSRRFKSRRREEFLREPESGGGRRRRRRSRTSRRGGSRRGGGRETPRTFVIARAHFPPQTLDLYTKKNFCLSI